MGPLLELLVVFVFLPAFLLVALALMASAIDGPFEDSGPLRAARGFQRAARGLSRSQFTIAHAMIGVAAAALAAACFVSPRLAVATIVIMAALAVLGFLKAWGDEITYLMGLRDDDLPGEYDKILWLMLLVTLAPLSVWWFRSFRRARWPELDPSMDFEHEEKSRAKASETTQPA